MKIDITYKFDINKYKYELANKQIENIVDGSRITYKYIDKMNNKCAIDIMLKSVQSQNLLGNDLFGSFVEMTDLYTKISFLNYDDYCNFTLPSWLDNFKYIN